MVLMGGPIDTRSNPTVVNKLAEAHGIDWFRDNVIMQVPWPHPGFMREVYPGFLQLSGFMSMNLDRHIIAHKDFFMHLVKDDGDSAEKHREFYDEYLAVMDLTAEFYLQTVETVFIEHHLPLGKMMHRAEPVDPAAIRNVALLTVEGENDDISGLGQTEAALAELEIPQLEAHGAVSHAWLGVGVQNLPEDRSKMFYPSDSGIIVARVEHGSPADKAGILPGDILLELNHKKLTDSTQLVQEVGKLAVGTKVDLLVGRQGQQRSFSIALDKMPDTALRAPGGEDEQEGN